MYIKKLTGAFLAAILICGLVGCGQTGQPARQGTAAHEVLTLNPIPEDKTLITLRSTDGVQVEALEQGIEAHFPDVDIVVTNNTWIGNDMANANFQDIILVANSIQVQWDAQGSLIDLSSENYLQNYYLSALQSSVEGDGVYYLPGPSNIYGVVYNKDMFAAHGWEVPTTLDEFIALCQTIEAEGVRAIQPALFYRDAGRQFFTGFTYEPIFAGLENSVWYDAYRTGKAVMAGHMEPAFEIMQRFIDAGILRPGDYEVKPAERSTMMYKEQSCAMILETQDAIKYRTRYGGENAPELGMMPLFSGNGPDSDYLLAVPQYFMGANIALEQSGNEKKRAKVKEILAFLSSVEGQKAVTPDDSTMISSLRGMDLNNSEFLSGVADTIEKGHVVNQPFFVGASNTEVDNVLKENLALFVQGGVTVEQVMSDLDAARDMVLLEEDMYTNVTVIGTVEETFSVLQTAQLFADIFRERANTQIGLCLANTRRQGCTYKLYQGELTFDGSPSNTLEYYIEMGFMRSEVDENGQKLTRLAMTGDALLQTLNEIYLPGDSYPDAYWVASGLKITFAPWAGDGNRILSVTLADGTEIDPNAVYTVAAWNGSVDPSLIQKVEAFYDDTITDLFRRRVETAGSIKPELDDYFILNWDVVV